MSFGSFSGFEVIESNNMESLADVCALIMRNDPLPDPFAEECIVVMNLGIQNYITTRLALQNDIAVRFKYTQIWQLIYRVFFAMHPEHNDVLNNFVSPLSYMPTDPDDVSGSDVFDRQHLKWTVYSVLSRLAEEGRFDNSENSADLFAYLRSYVTADSAKDRIFELACGIADCFDQYQMYRPEWILTWNKIRDEDFAAYEQNPEDQANPIYKFIEEQCKNFVRRKSGLLSAEAKARAEKIGSDTEKGRIFMAIAADNMITESEINSSVDRIRRLFKKNVWQIRLWCELKKTLYIFSHEPDSLPPELRGAYLALTERTDRAQILKSMTEELSSAEVLEAPLPVERIFIFGVSALPGSVMRWLNALSRHCRIYYMFLNPCMHFWADIASSRFTSFRDFIRHVQGTRVFDSAVRAALKKKTVDMAAVTSELKCSDYDREGNRTEGHPLLLSLGRQGRNTVNMLYDTDMSITGVFSEPLEEGEFVTDRSLGYYGGIKSKVTGGTLLKYLQTSLYRLDNKNELYEIDPADRSLCVVSAFTVRRELEKLYDHLLRLFNSQCCPFREKKGRCKSCDGSRLCSFRSRTDLPDGSGVFYRCLKPSLRPGDITVMVPAIKTYAPYINAVFGSSERGADARIPFVISDQTETESNKSAAALIRLLDMASESVTAADVAELLTEPSVARKFGIDEIGAERICKWMSENRIFRWLNAEEASANDNVEIEIPGTFEAGLERMIESSLTGDDSLCADNIEGSETELLGALWTFVRALKELKTEFTPHLRLSPFDWQERLNSKLKERFFDDSESTGKALACVDKIIEDMTNVFSHINNAPMIDLSVFKLVLENELKAMRNYSPFIGDRVNFCSLVPMRAVPFKHICILGLNDTDFPRPDKSPGFDLLSIPDLFERGDRSAAADDRYLFLEALISARESIYMSYVGKNPNDMSEINPSPVLSEVLYYLSDRCRIPLPSDPEQAAAVIADPAAAVIKRICSFESLNSYNAQNYIPEITESNAKAKAALKALSDRERTPYESVFDVSAAVRSLPSFRRGFIHEPKIAAPSSAVLANGSFASLISCEREFTLDLTELARTLNKPAKSFLNRSLGIYTDAYDSLLQTDENFDVSDRISVGNILSDLISLEEDKVSDRLKHMAFLGMLPYGAFGNVAEEQCKNMHEKIKQSLKDACGIYPSDIHKISTGKRVNVELLIPKDALTGNALLTADEIFSLYNHGAGAEETPDLIKFTVGVGSDFSSHPVEILCFTEIDKTADKNADMLYSGLSSMLAYFINKDNAEAAALQKSEFIFADRNGELFRISPFADENEAESVMKRLLISYILYIHAPYPGGKESFSCFKYHERTNRPLSAADNGSGFAFKREAAYLFNDPAEIMRSEVLCRRLYGAYSQFVSLYSRFAAKNNSTKKAAAKSKSSSAAGKKTSSKSSSSKTGKRAKAASADSVQSD